MNDSVSTSSPVLHYTWGSSSLILLARVDLPLPGRPLGDSVDIRERLHHPHDGGGKECLHHHHDGGGEGCFHHHHDGGGEGYLRMTMVRLLPSLATLAGSQRKEGVSALSILASSLPNSGLMSSSWWPDVFLLVA